MPLSRGSGRNRCATSSVHAASGGALQRRFVAAACVLAIAGAVGSRSVGAQSNLVPPKAPDASPSERAKRDADKVFHWILIQGDRSRRAPRDERAASKAARPAKVAGETVPEVVLRAKPDEKLAAATPESIDPRPVTETRAVSVVAPAIEPETKPMQASLVTIVASAAMVEPAKPEAAPVEIERIDDRKREEPKAEPPDPPQIPSTKPESLQDEPVRLELAKPQAPKVEPRMVEAIKVEAPQTDPVPAETAPVDPGKLGPLKVEAATPAPTKVEAAPKSNAPKVDVTDTPPPRPEPRSAATPAPLPTPTAPAPALEPATIDEAELAVPGSESLVPISQAQPQFSGSLMRSLRRGTVLVRFNVQPDGTVADLSIVQTSNPRLNAAALAAIALWRFQPPGHSQGAVAEVGFDLE